MSAAEKYGSPASSLSTDSLSQVRAAGQALASNGVTQQSSLGSGAPAPTPAVKYGAPSNSEAMGRSLSQGAQGRSL